MNRTRISRESIIRYIKLCKLQLRKLRKEIVKMEKENETANIMVYDITDSYLLEENYLGQIKAATYILNNC